MALGAAALIAGGSIVSGMMGSRAAGKQAKASRGATAEQRRQFDLIRQDTAPYRQVGQNALFEMSGMLGLGGQDDSRLNMLRNRLAGTPQTVSGPGQEQMSWQQHPDRRGFAMLPTETTQQVANPEFQSLQDEIASLEAEIGEGGEPFDVTQIPGYQFRFDQGINALNNSLAAGGDRFSGRAMKAAQRFGQGIASQEYGQHFNRLAGLAGTGQTAVGQSGTAGMQAAGNIGNAMMAGGRAQAQGLGSINQAVQGGIGNYLAYQQNQQLLNQLGNQWGPMVGPGTGRR